MVSAKRLQLFKSIVLLLSFVGLLLSGFITNAHAQAAPTAKLQGIPAGAGNIWITGHDADIHCFDTSGGNQCNYLGAAVMFVVNKSPLSILALDHGTQVATAIGNAYSQLGSTAPQVVRVDPRTQFASLPLVSEGKPLYSAIVVASDTTCGALPSGPPCGNNEIGSTPDSDAINNRAGDIEAFFLAGGGILALAGAEHRDVYYNFLPVEVTPVDVTPPPDAPGNQASGMATAFNFAPDKAFPNITLLGLQCCITHNSFIPLGRSPLAVLEKDAFVSSEPGVSFVRAVTMFGGAGFSSSELKHHYLELALEIEVKALFIKRIIDLVPSESTKQGLEQIVDLWLGDADNYLKLAEEDPIDLNFMNIAQPVVPQVPEVTAGGGVTEREAAAVNALNNNLALQIAFSNAILTSNNRFQGARLVGNSGWEASQLRAAQQYQTQLAKLVNTEPRLLAETANAFQAAGIVSGPITAADVRKAQNDIATHGLAPGEIQVLTQLGKTETDIRQIQQDLIALDPNAVAALGGGQFPQVLVAAQPLQIVQAKTFREEVLVFFRLYFTDPSNTAVGFGFQGVNGSGWGLEEHPFTSPSYGRVLPGIVEYPFNHLCGQPGQYESDVEAWIYDNAGQRTPPVTIHLACSAPIG